MNNFTQTVFTFRTNAFKNFVATLGLVLTLLISSNSFGQTVVTVGGGVGITCPTTPTATWTTPPTGVTFSNWSRGSGVTCASASNGLSGSTFSSTSAAASVTANKFYSVTITANATTNVNLSNIVWNTVISSGTCTFAVMYSNNGGAITQFGTNGANTSAATTTNTFTDSVNIAAGTSLILYMVPFNATSGSTIRWVNGSTTTVTATTAGPTVNGTIAANEYGVHTNGSNQETNAVTWYNTWDTTNLYFGIGATSNNSTEASVIYLDVNPIVPVNGGTNANGTNVGFAYDRSNVSPAFRADYVLYFKSGYYELRAANGTGGWNTTPVTTGLTYAQSGAGATQGQEISIPWSALGGSIPASFNWSAYKMYDVTASNNGIYGQLPANNPGGAQNVAAYTLANNRYYTVSSTASGSSTLPFSRISYCQPIGTTTNGFGSASFYDFTVNPGAGFQVARSATAGGAWTISGNLVVGSGNLYFGSGGSTFGTTTVGNINVVGGALNMDQTNVAMTVTGNVSVASGATLALSGTAGGDLNVAGNWSNLGTFTPSTRLVQFNGTVAQTLTGVTTFDYIKMNNSLGLTLNNAVTVNTNLDLTSGKITLGTNNLTLGAAATATNASATGYVVTNSTGAFVKTNVGNTATAFPVGLAASYTPLTVTNTGTTNTLSLVVKSPPTNAVTNSAKIVNLEWDLTSAGAGAVTDVTFNWNTPSNVGASYVATGTGELGNYTAGPNYAITAIGTMAGTTKAVTGIALSSGSNKLVIGNSAAVYLIAPANDLCSNATNIIVDAAAITGTETGANPTAGLTYAVTKNDVWYKFTPTNSGTHSVNVNFTTGPDLDVDVFTTSCPSSGVGTFVAHTTGATSEILTASFTAGITYYIRVVDYNTNASTFTISVTGPPATLNTSVSSVTFTSQAPLTASASQTFNLSGFSLTGAPGTITVTSPNTDYKVSNDNATWGATTTISYSSSTLSATPVYVQFIPQSSGTKTGNITFSGGGAATPPTVALSGTGVLPAPVATAATNILATSFDANWNAVTGASSGYLLDVSTSPTFGTTTPTTLNEGFAAGTTAPSGYTFTTIGGTYSTPGNYGTASPSLQMDATNDRVLTGTYAASATQMSFWMKGNGTDATSALLVEGFNGVSWVTIQNIVPISLTGTTYTYTSATSPALPANITQFRYTYTKSAGNIGFDDVNVNYDVSVPSFVTGYNAKPITGQATVTAPVTGLTADTTYYYRLRATDGTPSVYSNVITVNPASRGGSVTADQTICSGTAPATLTLSGNNGTVVKWQSATNTAFTGAVDISNTTSTLTGAAIGTLTTTTYFRAVVQSFSNPTANSAYATITVTQSPTFANLQSPPSGAICQTGTFDAYGQVYQAGVTEAAGAGAGITAEFGYSTTNNNPSTWTNWSTATFNVQSGNNDEYKYTFTPPSSGTFYYTFRYRQGTCAYVYGGYNSGFWNGTTNVNGSLVVSATAVAGTANTSQTICSGLTPSALTLNGSVGSIQWQSSTDNSTFSAISGQTSATLTLGALTTTTYYRAFITSGSCPSATSNTVTITVIQSPTFANLQSPPSGTICQSGTFDIYGQVYQAGVTEAAGAGAGITAEFGYSTSNTNPSTWTNWSAATFNVQSGNNDEYKFTFSPPASGTYYYTFRYRQGSCANVYGGYSSGGGGFWNGTSNVSGVLTVNQNHAIALSSGSNTPTLCQNSVLATPIVYAVSGGATGAGVTGLPTGMSGTYSGGNFTISGTPTVSGTFNYTVTTTGNACTVATATGVITVNPTLFASVSISATATTICAGTSVTFTATPTNGGTPSYQWQVNGTDVSGETASTFTTTTLNNNDSVTVVMTSTATPCLTGSPATSNAISITVNPSLVASVSISASATTICAGTSVTFTATPTNGGTPTYQWQVNGTDVSGQTASTFTTTTIANNDSVTVVMTSNATPCLTGSPATSNAISITVNPTLVASVSISASATTICAGTSVTFTATPTNGGTPTYQWQVNGTDVSGQTASTFTTTTLNNNDSVTVVMTSNATPCLTGSPATSNAISITVNPTLVASVSISATATTICAGTSVTFTATPTNGGTPSYQWQVNGTDVSGETASTFTTTTLANNDSVTVVMTSTATPCLTGSPATSNAISITVNPTLVASVSISASATTICTGTSVTFTATPTNGGTPTYQWQVNGTDVSGQTASTFTTTTLNNNDSVTVVMTSTATPCLTGSPATSNAISITVNPTLVASVSISASATTICAGTSVTFTATPTNGGTPTYQWQVNGTDVSGQTASTFTTTTLNNNDSVTVVMTSTATPCLTGSPATSNAISITVNPVPTA
ncbi:hypothetical protein OX283_014735, partial [Flavobacterium sp. SUN052]|uniref:hypothetical protein n=1 Tax=Flavobacterium sp. SUN052 TaxID=3002441 RepID=UPI00237E0BFC